jgi:cell division septal protein FtsQ
MLGSVTFNNIFKNPAFRRQRMKALVAVVIVLLMVVVVVVVVVVAAAAVSSSSIPFRSIRNTGYL